MRKSTARKMKADREAYLATETNRKRLRSAVHEAGHAIASLELRDGLLQSIDIFEKQEQRGDMLFIYSGYTDVGRRTVDSADLLLNELTADFAGPLAEMTILTEEELANEDNMWAQGDTQHAQQLFDRFYVQLNIPSYKRDEMMEQACERARVLINENIDKLNAIAAALYEAEYLSGNAVRAICAEQAVA